MYSRRSFFLFSFLYHILKSVLSVSNIFSFVTEHRMSFFAFRRHCILFCYICFLSKEERHVSIFFPPDSRSEGREWMNDNRFRERQREQPRFERGSEKKTYDQDLDVEEKCQKRKDSRQNPELPSICMKRKECQVFRWISTNEGAWCISCSDKK